MPVDNGDIGDNFGFRAVAVSFRFPYLGPVPESPAPLTDGSPEPAYLAGLNPPQR